MVSRGDPGCDPGSAELGRDLLASLPAVVAYVAGADMVFEFASAGFCQVHGNHDVIGRPFREVLPELVGQPPFEAIREVLRTGERRHARGQEVRPCQAGAQPPTYIDSVYQPVLDDAGQVAGVLIFSTDVSDHVRDRHQLEELTRRLQRSEEQYQTLFDTLPHGIIRYDQEGSVIGANPAAVEILGLVPDQMRPADRARQGRHEDGTPYRPEELPAMIALRTGEVVPDVTATVRNARTGEIRWIRSSAVPDARDAQGRPQRAYTVFTDITEQRQAQAALRESNRLLGRLREENVLGVLVANEQAILDANDAFLDMIGYARGDLEAGRITWRGITPPQWAQADADAVEQMRRTGAFQPYDKEYLHRDGHRVPVLIGAAAIDRAPLRWTTFVVDLSARQRGEQERAELLAREQAARLAAEAAQDRLALLLEASSLVEATGNPEALQGRLTQLIVPALADSCVLIQLTGQGALRVTDIIHRDPARAAILDGLRGIDIPPGGPPLRDALSRATAQLVTDVTTLAPGRSDAARAVTDVLRRARVASMVVSPFLVGQRLEGAVILGRDEGRPHFTETDVAVIGELSRRLAAGWATVETFAREHTVAETLQRALMPDALPGIPGLDLAVRYLPATGGVYVGGDWYDVFPLGHDQVALAIGDVVGHSISSASVMGQIRSLLRAYTLDRPAPADVLRRTNAAVCQLLPDATATVFYGVLDMSTGDLAYANAGHPPALLDDGEGQGDYLDGPPGAMLGVSADSGYSASHRQLAPGCMLLLYTDGLVEDRRRDIAEGFGGLARAMRRSLARTAEQTCQFVQTTMLGSGSRADDVCILAVRLQDLAAPARAARPGAPGPRRGGGRIS